MSLNVKTERLIQVVTQPFGVFRTKARLGDRRSGIASLR